MAKEIQNKIVLVRRTKANPVRFALGTKLHMTQIFDKAGLVHPVTIVDAPDAVVVQVKKKEKDGYSAVQLGFGTKSIKNISKPEIGHMKNLGNFRWIKEFRVSDEANLPNVGDKISATELFEESDYINISGVTKGKGFQGVVKRYGFRGGPRSHGQKHSEREPGSIGGAGRDGGRVAKGKRMAGRMGGDRITVMNLKIVMVDKENKQIYIEGAVPGIPGTLVEMKG